MKANKISPVFLILSLALGLTTSCTRDGITEPPVSGPSSFAVLLQLSASPNAVFAGLSSRGLTTVSARLKKYNNEPLASRTVYFEIVDGSGNKSNVGYFEGDTGVLSKTTDGNGEVRVNYYGPLHGEIASNVTIYIRATVAWQGVESIYEFAPVDIIKESTAVTLSVKAEPDVLYASDTNPRSTITVTAIFGNKPLSNYKIYFLIQSGPGHFEDGLTATFKDTDASGRVVMDYIGPTGDLIGGDTSVLIRVQLFENNYQEFFLRLVKRR